MAGKVGDSNSALKSAEGWADALSAGVQVSITKHMETEAFPEAFFTGRFELHECGAEERALKTEETRQTKEELVAVLEQMKTMEPSASEEARAVRELLDLQNSFEYPYDKSANLPIKVTVSELKRLHLEAEEREGAGENGSSVQSVLPEEIPFDEISFETGISIEEIAVATDAGKGVESIYNTIYQSDGNQMYIVDKLAASVENNDNEKIMNHMMLEETMHILDDTERTLINMRYYQDKTQTEVAKHLGISQVQVSRMEKKILLRMRKNMEG
jgi:RNA polymerase sporulation-specific sigma factor